MEDSEETVAYKQAQASDPATLPHILEHLGRDKESTVRRAVAQNPNTPLARLLRLAKEFPEEVLTNPVWQLLLFTQPDMSQQIDVQTWLYLLRHEYLPLYWYQWLLNALDLLGRWARFAREPREKMTIQALHDRWKEAWALQDRWEIPTDDTHFATIGDLTTTALLYIQTEQVPPEVLTRIRKSHPKLRGVQEVFSWAPPPAKWLTEMIAHPAPEFRAAAAAHPEASAEMLKLLAQDPDRSVRHEMARRPDLPVEILRLLIDDADDHVSEPLATQTHLPTDLMWHLSADPAYYVKLKLVSRLDLPEALLRHLLADHDIISTLAHNPTLPDDLLVFLANHHDEFTRSAVASQPELPDQLMKRLAADRDEGVRRQIARRSDLPEAILVQLMEDKPYVVRAIAENEATPPHLLARLAATGGYHYPLARNKSTPPEILEQLGEVYAVRWHPGLSSAYLDKLATTENGENRKIAIYRLAHHLSLDSGYYERTRQGNLLNEYEAHLQVDQAIFSPPEENIYSRLFGSTWGVSEAASARLVEHLLTSWAVRIWQMEDDPFEPVELPITPDTSWIAQHWQIRRGGWQKWEYGRDNINDWGALFARLKLPEKWQPFFAISPYWWERYLLVMKPETTRSTLEKLTHDGNRYVRSAARWKLETG